MDARKEALLEVLSQIRAFWAVCGRSGIWGASNGPSAHTLPHKLPLKKGGGESHDITRRTLPRVLAQTLKKTKFKQTYRGGPWSVSGSGSGKVWGLTGLPIWVWVWGNGGGVVEGDWEGLGIHDDTTTGSDGHHN